MRSRPCHSPSAGLLVAVFAAGLASLGVAGCGGSRDDRPAQWSFISAAIMEPSCATVNCHSAVAKRAGVDLHARDVGYASLHDRNFLIPVLTGDATTAPIIDIMHAQGSRRMPPDNPLPEVDIELIEKWITAGAMNN